MTGDPRDPRMARVRRQLDPERPLSRLTAAEMATLAGQMATAGSRSVDNTQPEMYSGIYRWRVRLNCGCLPLYYHPIPARGDEVTCTTHGLAVVTRYRKREPHDKKAAARNRQKAQRRRAKEKKERGRSTSESV